MYYTYLWLRYDGTPYYVGKGSGRRAFTSKSHGVHRPADKSRILVQHCVSEQEAFEAEIFFIEYYGRQDLGTGCLRNLTDGGEGGSGFSEEVRKKMGDMVRGTKRPPRTKEWCDKLSAAKMGHEVSLETRIKLTKNVCVRGHARTPDNLTKSGACVLCRELKNTGIPCGRKRVEVCARGHIRTTEKLRQGCKVCREEKRAEEGRRVNNPGILKPFCSRGHARIPDNVYGSGDCKVCAKQRAELNRRAKCTSLRGNLGENSGVPM